MMMRTGGQPLRWQQQVPTTQFSLFLIQFFGFMSVSIPDCRPKGNAAEPQQQWTFIRRGDDGFYL